MASPEAILTKAPPAHLGRAGGRLDTDLVYMNGEPVKTKKGGMRFDDGVTNLTWLLKTLSGNNDIMPFSMGDANNNYFLRGRRFTFGQMDARPNLWGTIYNLSWPPRTTCSPRFPGPSFG